MNCPKCHTALNPVTVAGVEIDRCPACSGQWYDEGEIARLVPLLAESDTIPEADVAAHALRPAPTPSARNLPCPRCQHAMGTINYAYDSNIMVDRCEACRGLWLDVGECAAIIRLVKGNPKMTRMGKALADQAASEQRRQETLETIASYTDDANLLAGLLQHLFRRT